MGKGGLLKIGAFIPFLLGAVYSRSLPPPKTVPTNKIPLQQDGFRKVDYIKAVAKELSNKGVEVKKDPHVKQSTVKAVSPAPQKLGELKKDYYRKQIADFFNAIDRARILFSQFKDGKKIGGGYIEFDKCCQNGNFIKIHTAMGEREFTITGSSLDDMEFYDHYLEERRNVKAPEIVRLMFGKDKDVTALLKKSFVTEKYGKVVAIIKYDDFTGYHKIILCFNQKPFTLRLWRVINRGEESSYIKVDDIRYNYKNS